MLTCPMCKKNVPKAERQCPSCRADLSLLADYVSQLQDGLARADSFTRAGELGEAVWAYLEVLEVDPDNATARRQVGRVAAAVRQFDRAAPGRRWLRGLQRRAHFRRWATSLGTGGPGSTGWFGLALLFLAVLGALVLGYTLGHQAAQPPAGDLPAESSTP